jgi:hypothetical protein
MMARRRLLIAKHLKSTTTKDNDCVNLFSLIHTPDVDINVHGMPPPKRSSFQILAGPSPYCLIIDHPPARFRFLDLPAELRNPIYEEVLVVDKAFFSNNKSGDRYAKPQVALLRICKQIYTKAEQVYLGNSLLHLPTNWHNCNPFQKVKRYATSQKPKARHLFS